MSNDLCVRAAKLVFFYLTINFASVFTYADRVLYDAYIPKHAPMTDLHYKINRINEEHFDITTKLRNGGKIKDSGLKTSSISASEESDINDDQDNVYDVEHKVADADHASPEDSETGDRDSNENLRPVDDSPKIFVIKSEDIEKELAKRATAKKSRMRKAKYKMRQPLFEPLIQFEEPKSTGKEGFGNSDTVNVDTVSESYTKINDARNQARYKKLNAKYGKLDNKLKDIDWLEILGLNETIPKRPDREDQNEKSSMLFLNEINFLLRKSPVSRKVQRSVLPKLIEILKDAYLLSKMTKEIIINVTQIDNLAQGKKDNTKALFKYSDVISPEDFNERTEEELTFLLLNDIIHYHLTRIFHPALRHEIIKKLGVIHRKLKEVQAELVGSLVQNARARKELSKKLRNPRLLKHFRKSWKDSVQKLFRGESHDSRRQEEQCLRSDGQCVYNKHAAESNANIRGNIRQGEKNDTIDGKDKNDKKDGDDKEKVEEGEGKNETSTKKPYRYPQKGLFDYWLYKKSVVEDECPDGTVRLQNVCVRVPPH